MKMVLYEHPRKFLLLADRMVIELEQVERPMDPKDVDIVILGGLTNQYDTELRMLQQWTKTSHAVEIVDMALV